MKCGLYHCFSKGILYFKIPQRLVITFHASKDPCGYKTPPNWPVCNNMRMGKFLFFFLGWRKNTCLWHKTTWTRKSQTRAKPRLRQPGWASRGAGTLSWGPELPCCGAAPSDLLPLLSHQVPRFQISHSCTYWMSLEVEEFALGM